MTLGNIRLTAEQRGGRREGDTPARAVLGVRVRELGTSQTEQQEDRGNGGRSTPSISPHADPGAVTAAAGVEVEAAGRRAEGVRAPATPAGGQQRAHRRPPPRLGRMQ